jgi:membrane dipeptidase
MNIQWAQKTLRDTLVWDAHAGIFPAAGADLSGVPEWTSAGFDYVSINVGFDVLDRENTIKTLSWYRSQLGMMGNAVSIIKSVAILNGQ